MPEGDTIFRAARTLRAALAGKRVVTLKAPNDPSHAAPAIDQPVNNITVESVEPNGKHLLIRFDDGRTLRTHMGMPGSWHVYRPGEPWQRSARRVRALVEVHDAVAVCFAAPIATLTRESVASRATAHLGPDVLDPDFDASAMSARLRAAAKDERIGVALLDQRLAAGIGNIYKNETLFACRINPFTPVADLSDAMIEKLYETASTMMKSNLDQPGGRITFPGGPGVYRRTGLPCRRCDTTIVRYRQGPLARPTFWCPDCQPGPKLGV